ncbi:hypothetical protein ACCS33_20285 [Rhizobium ruizarguesonis]
MSTYLIPTFLYDGLNQRTDDYGVHGRKSRPVSP